MPTHMWGLCTVFILGAPAPYLQQGPFVTLGTLVALLLLPIYGVVDSGAWGKNRANMDLPTHFLLSPGNPVISYPV